MLKTLKKIGIPEVTPLESLKTVQDRFGQSYSLGPHPFNLISLYILLQSRDIPTKIPTKIVGSERIGWDVLGLLTLLTLAVTVSIVW